MPGTTRYSATFDRPYEEEERIQSAAASNGMRRSRSQSLANLGLESRPFTPTDNSRPSTRSSSTDGGPANIPTRTVSKPVVKSHNNPFQFVKVSSSPLYRKAEEQLKKVKEVKKVEVVQEEEEEWQSNLDSWKSRRRKMSEDVFKRQEEIRELELEQQQQTFQANQKKIKTFSEMVESRATRGRTMSLCLISSPLELQKWELENNNAKNNGTHSYSEGSEENSAVNSEDEGIVKRMVQNNLMNKKSQSADNIVDNVSASISKNKNSRFFELGENGLVSKDGVYLDSGLESISSSHRAGDTPDSCSDFSQDSGSCIDCDSPRASGLVLNGVNLLEEFNSKDLENDDNQSLSNGCEKNENHASVSNGTDVLNHQFSPPSSYSNCNGNKTSNSTDNCVFSSCSSDQFESSEGSPQKKERSVESENEVFVDDFEELNNNDKILEPNSFSPKIEDSASVNKEMKETQPTPSQISHCGIFTIKVATVVETTGETSEDTTELLENKNSTLCNSSVDCVSNLNNADEVTIPFRRKGIKYVQHNEDENTNVVFNIKKPKNKSSKKKTDLKSSPNEKCSSQKPNVDADLNVVFQSATIKEDNNTNSTQEIKPTVNIKDKVVLNDVLPVEQVAEEMERLILQQLEEEERAKELSSYRPPVSPFNSPEHNLIFRSRSTEPPKEKPPPPPSADNDVQKPASLKRVNSTKRIKKEICKRRSNFLGIDTDDDAICDEVVIPPPPALEQILKAEMELDKESRKRLQKATTDRLILEENEIRKREQEIIETMEIEERQKQLINNYEKFDDGKSNCAEVCDIMQEEDRIEILKEEKKRIEKDRILSEEQRVRLLEEKQLREREEFIRKQEADNTTLAELSVTPLSGIVHLPNAPKSDIASHTPYTKVIEKNVNLNGDGGNVISNPVSEQVNGIISDKISIPNRPAVPPKPLKKKEAIRKERERLRQEQEDLVREREEHRRKLKEEEEMLKSQKNSHAPGAPVSRLGPLPSLIKPAYTPQLTSPPSAQPSARENTAVASRGYFAAQNGKANSNGEPVNSPANKHNKPIPPPKKTIKSELRNQQKVASIKKQPHDPLTESKYNQNHWLIQEAEMRRITELKERQRATQFSNSQTHLAEDDVCRAPVISPSVHLNNPVQEKIWNYGHSNQAIKLYPPAVSCDKPLGTYTREHTLQPPAKPSRVVPLERQEEMLSVSGRKRCSHCNEELGRGAAMIIESLHLYYHIHCFQCCVCQAQLGNGSCGADVRVRNNKLHCHNCYSNDEAGLKFSQV